MIERNAMSYAIRTPWKEYNIYIYMRMTFETVRILDRMVFWRKRFSHVSKLLKKIIYVVSELNIFD